MLADFLFEFCLPIITYFRRHLCRRPIGMLLDTSACILAPGAHQPDLLSKSRAVPGSAGEDGDLSNNPTPFCQ